jgi:hypothetical protein
LKLDIIPNEGVVLILPDLSDYALQGVDVPVGIVPVIQGVPGGRFIKK